MTPRTALVWSFAERYASFVITFASTVLLARLLTPAQVGVFSMCMALMAVLGIVRDFGVSEYLIQARELTRQRVAAAFGVALTVGWALAAAVFASRGALAAYFDEPAVGQVLAVLSVQMALLPVTSPVFALLNRELAFRRVFVLQLACNAAQAGVTLALAARGHGSLALAWGPVVNIGVQTLLLLAWRSTRAQFVAPAFSGWREVLRFGLPYAGSRGLETLSRNVHEPVIARAFDFASVGLFSRAWGLVEMFHSHVADAVLRVATPAFAKAHRDGQPLAPALARAVTLYVSVSWPFFAFVALMAEEVIGVLFGPQWLAAAPLASILALAALPAGLYELVPQMLSATGHVQRRLRISAWVAPVHVVGVVLAAQLGLAAVAAVSSLTSCFMLALCARELRRGLGINGSVLARAGLASLPVAAASAASMAVAAAGARGAGWPAAASLLLVLLIGAVAWWWAAVWCRHPMRPELLAVWKRIHVRTLR